MSDAQPQANVHVTDGTKGTNEPPEPDVTSTETHQPTSTAATATTTPERTWDELTAYVRKWFYKPDTEALAAALAVCASHTLRKRDPLWAFLIGPPSSFKTSCVIQACSAIPNAHVLSKITTKAFVSHHSKSASPNSKRRGGAGLLERIGPSGILLFKDFTTVLSMREDDRGVIAGDLREIYDGRITLESGVGGSIWEGKITILAACTPALDRYWALKRDLGDRFLGIRLPYIEDDDEMAIRAMEQSSTEEQIASSISMLGRRMISYAQGSAGPPPKAFLQSLGSLAHFVARLRGQVHHSQHNRNAIEDVSCEQSPRLAKELALLLMSHAAMFQRPPDERDMRIVRRVGLDTIPEKRLKVVLALTSGAEVTRVELVKVTGIEYEGIRYVCAELKALGVVVERTESDTGTDEKTYSLHPKYAEYMKRAGLVL